MEIDQNFYIPFTQSTPNLTHQYYRRDLSIELRIVYELIPT